MHRELDSRITPEGDVIGLWWDDETDDVQLVIEPADGERVQRPRRARARAATPSGTRGRTCPRASPRAFSFPSPSPLDGPANHQVGGLDALPGPRGSAS